MYENPKAYKTVNGINWISGWACKKILERGPTAMYYMGLIKSPHIIYDLAYSPEETIEIGARVLVGMNLGSMEEVFSAKLSENTAASLYYIVHKYYPEPDMTRLYKIEIPYTKGKDEPFLEWCKRVKGRKYNSPLEKVTWWREWENV